MSRNLLVTGIGGDIGCSMLRCLDESDHVGYDKILGCDINPINAGRLFVDGFFEAPYADDSRYVSFLLDVAKKEDIALICPSTEQEIQVLDKHREDFAAAGISLLINNRRIIRTFSSKYQTVQALERIRVNVPRTWKDIDRALASGEATFPLVVKDDYGRGSQCVFLAHTENELRECAQKCETAVIQECIGTPENEYTVGVFSNERQTESIAFRRELGPNGASTLVEYVDDPSLNAIAKRVADEFDLLGSINIQLRKQDSQYYVFEVNPRISSTVRFRWLAGFPDLAWWIAALDCRSQHVDYCPSRPFIGVKLFEDRLVAMDDDGALEWRAAESRTLPNGMNSVGRS